MTAWTRWTLWSVLLSQETLADERRLDCKDVPGWTDNEGYSCHEYANRSWCTEDGAEGFGWQQTWGGFEERWREGFTAQAACCACGGGQVQSIAGLWQVLQGPCTVDTEGCLLSPNYPQNYSNNQRCTIIVNQTLAQPIRVVDWDVEYWFDFLLINGRLFSGTLQPLNQTPNGSMHWVSDEDTTGTGWKLCPGNGTSSEAVIGSTTSSSERSTTPVASSTTTEVTESTSSSSSSSSSTPLPTSSPSAPSTCKDVEGWMDAAEFSCNEYAQEQWCTVEKHPGPHWEALWGPIEDYWNFGFSAFDACCACGGGQNASISVLWMVQSGPCTMVDGCILSPNYPSNYSNNQRCTIAVNQSLARPFQVVDFDTERNYDRLTVNGRSYSGRKKPSGVVPFTAIGWESDEDLTARGWKICPGDFAQGPEMFSVVGGPCTVDSSGCVMSPNYPQTYGPNQDCAIQVFNPDNKSLTVESFATEMNYDVLWVNGRMFAGTTSPHGLVPTEAIQWSSDQDTEDRGWKICPGPVGQQVAEIQSVDEGDNEEAYDYDYGYGPDALSPDSGAGPAGTAPPQDDLSASKDVGVSTGNFFFKVALASIAVCLAGVLCLRYRRQRKENRNEFGTPYGRSYALDNL